MDGMVLLLVMMVGTVLAVAVAATLMHRYWNYIMERWYGHSDTRWCPSRVPSTYPPPSVPHLKPLIPLPDPQPRSTPPPPYTPTLSDLSTTHRPTPPTLPTLRGAERSDHNTTWPDVFRVTTSATTSSVLEMEDDLEEEMEGWRDNERKHNGKGEWNNGRHNSSDWDNSMYDCGRTDEKMPFLYIPPIPADAKLTMSFPETRHALRAPFTDSSSSASSCAEATPSGSCRTKDNASSSASSFASWKTAPSSVPYSSVTSDSWKTASGFCDENHSASSSICEHTSTTVPSSVSAPSWKKRIVKSLTSVFKVGTYSAPASCTTSQEFDRATPASSCNWLIGEEFEYATEASSLCRERESHTSSSSSSGYDNNTNRSKKLYAATDSPVTSSSSAHQDRAGRDDIKATLEVLVTAIHRLPSLQQPHQQQQYESIIDNITR